MSIELEKLVSDMTKAGVYPIVREGRIVKMRFSRGGCCEELMTRMRLQKAQIDRYFASMSCAVRCFECPKGDMCQDGTACQYPPA